jgi:hypothetical protein
LTRYDRAGRTYSSTRQPDPRIGAVINQALHGMTTVANIGAGTVSYEPTTTVIAVESGDGAAQGLGATSADRRYVRAATSVS